ncbi:S-layer homology domain-containing protein [Schnuerera ultunensis]|uniref:S-layer homology domain-containing protein n=1 Tax=Schnuerera ultunensis TaxID=45497 RepID=UPI00041616E3|nr:S-layer homology domain-containing protein [Schnuerera ultunensis]
MFINKNYHKTTILLIILLLAFNSMGVYGESMFTDINKNHWAYDYVEKVVNLGLMDGYDDATFRPNEEVNIADALVYVTRLFNLPKEEVEKMRQEHDELLDKFQLSEERKDGLAIALSKGLVTEIFVENNLFTQGKIRTATKMDLTNYIAKTMGIEEEEGEVYVFLFKDADSIPKRSRPYVSFLIDKGILEAKGDGEGKFNPGQPIIRSVLAKMLSLSYDKMDINPVTPGVSIEDPVEPMGKEPVLGDQITGIITSKVDKYIFIDNGQKVDSYTFEKDASITIDGNDAAIKELEPGMNIKAIVSEDNILKSLVVDSGKDIVSGTINKISLEASPSMVVDLDGGNMRTFHIPKDIKVWVNGKESYLFSLREGDKVKIEAFDDLALSISGESKNGKVIGIIKGRNFDEENMIIVERGNKTTYEYQLKEELLVYRNSSGVAIKKLRPGDQVILSISNGEVESVEANSTPGEDEGYIQEILISKEPKLSILNDRGELVVYYISPEALIKIDREVKSIYDLRLDYFAKLKLESDEIVNIQIER